MFNVQSMQRVLRIQNAKIHISQTKTSFPLLFFVKQPSKA